MPKRERELQVDSPRQCIHRYCLLHCEKMERKNSKRGVAECVIRECPLHPYRTGQLRAKGPIPPTEKNRRIVRLRTARRKIEKLSRTMGELDEKIKRSEEKTEWYKTQRTQAEEEMQNAKEKLERIEIQFSDELEQGLWK